MKSNEAMQGFIKPGPFAQGSCQPGPGALFLSPMVPQLSTRALQGWLYACAALVFLMILVGAITRLTDSGLSITQWKPVTGALPPLNEQAWQAEFDLYKNSPEFQKQNFWMELADFKKIYFWEWFHRLLGRLIGLAYALPLAWFWLRKKIPPGYGPRLLGILTLGAAQGLMGWAMVRSGLIDRPDVSHFRLAAHLLLALIIYAALIVTALSLRNIQTHPHRRLFIHALGAFAIFALTITWGAFTAGLDAGLVYNESFPKMAGRWIPPEVFSNGAPLYNILETPAAVQFAHRWLAIATLAAILALWLRTKLANHAFTALHLLALIALLQAGLGIVTLFSGVFLPLAVLHQAGAVLVLTFFVIVLKKLRP